MACGDAYRHMIVTSSGYTPEEPFGSWYDPRAHVHTAGDALEWWAIADTMRARATAKLAELQQAAKIKGRMDVYDDVVRLYMGPATNAFAAIEQPSKWKEVPAYLGPAGLLWYGLSTDDVTAWVQKAVESSEGFACAMEQADAAFGELGLTPPATPGRPPEAPETDADADFCQRNLGRSCPSLFKTVAVAGGVAVVGYFGLKYFLTRRAYARAAAAASPTPIVTPTPPTGVRTGEASVA